MLQKLTPSLVKLILLILVAGSSQAFAQNSTYEQALEICERYYEEGKYDKALELCKKTIEKTRKNNVKAAENKLLMYKAKYYEALADYFSFEATLFECLEQRENVYSKKSITYAKGLLDASYLYLLYTDIATSEKYLEDAEKILSELPNTDQDSYFEEHPLYIRTRIAMHRGLYAEAKENIPALLAIRQKRITDSETQFDEAVNSFISKNLNTFQQRRRKRAYAEILTLKGAIERNIGNYEQAEQDLEAAANWIKENLENNGVSFVNNEYQQILVLLDKGVQIDEAKKRLEKTLFLAERRLGLVHSDFLKIHESVIDYYIEDRYQRKSKIQHWEINNNTVKYFGDDRTPNAVAIRLDAKRDFYAKNFNAAEEKLIALYNDSTKVPDNHLERTRVLKQLYHLSISQDKYMEAKNYLDELITIQERILGTDALDYHYSKIELATYYQTYTNRFSAVDSLFKESFEGVIENRISEQHRDYVGFLGRYADYYKTIGKYDSAQVLANKAVEINKEKFGEEDFQYAIALEMLTDVYLVIGKFKEADANINKMLEIFEPGYKRRRLDSEYSSILETSARYYATMGLFNEAQQNLAKANRLNNRSAASIANSSAIDELAYLYIKTGRYDETEELLNEALETRIERYGENSRFLITPYNQLARLDYIEGNYIEAQELVQKAFAIASENFGENSLQITESLMVEADIFTAIGDFERAKENIQKVINIETDLLGGQHVELANSYTQLALTKYFNGENLDDIAKLFQQAQDIIRDNLGEDNPVYAVSLKNLSLVYTESDRFEEAINLLNSANQIWVQKLGTAQNINSAEIQLLIGDIEMRRGKAEAALVRYTDALKTYKKELGKDHPSYVKSISKMGRAYYTLAEYGKAEKYTQIALNNYLEYINKFFPVLSEREKARYWSLIRSDFEFFISLGFNTPKKPELIGSVYNNTLQTKALLLSSSIKIRNRIINSGDSTLIANYNDWVDKKDRLTEVLSMSIEQQKEEKLDPKKLQKEIEDIEKSLSQNALFEAGSEEKITWEQVRSNLQPNEVAVEIIRYRHFDKVFTDSAIYAAMIITPQTRTAPKLVFLPDGNYLETAGLSVYRSSVEYEIEDLESYQYFWRPIAEQLPALGENGRVYVSSEGVYSQINIEGLLIEDNNYVIDSTNIVLVSNTKDIVLSRTTNETTSIASSTGSEKISLFGNPVFYSDLSADEYNTYTDRPITQLPGTKIEIEKLDNLLENTPGVEAQAYINTEATEEQVRALQNPKIFHIATHGFFLADQSNENNSNLNQERAVTNPLLRSGVLLKNAGDLMADPDNVYAFNRDGGVLTAYEAMNLNFDNTELVVLSACETGKGDVKVGEGVYGLQRAFLVAGAEAIIMSLFKVDDEATQELMVKFYENWIEKKMDKRKAFKEAKISLREDFSDPKYWSAFIMIGSI